MVEHKNVNEAFSAYVWKRAPKDMFGSKNVLDMPVPSAVVAFNDGASSALKITKKVGISARYYNMEATHNANLVRISGEAYKATGSVKAQRKKLRSKKKKKILQCK